MNDSLRFCSTVPALRRGGRCATTLTELLVALMIMSFLLGALDKVIIRAQYMSMLAVTRGELKEKAELVFKQLRRDVESSSALIQRSGGQLVGSKEMTFGSNSWTMKVPNGTTYVTITYTFNKPNLVRQGNGENKTLCNHVEAFTLEDTGPAQVLAKITTGMIPDGHTKIVTHEQNALLTVQDAAAHKDPNWRSTTDPGAIR